MKIIINSLILICVLFIGCKQVEDTKPKVYKASIESYMQDNEIGDDFDCVEISKLEEVIQEVVQDETAFQSVSVNQIQTEKYKCLYKVTYSNKSFYIIQVDKNSFVIEDEIDGI